MEKTPVNKDVRTYSVTLPSGSLTGNEKIVVQVAKGENITIPLKNLPGFKPGGKVTIKQNLKDKKITVNYDKVGNKTPNSKVPSENTSTSADMNGDHSEAGTSSGQVGNSASTPIIQQTPGTSAGENSSGETPKVVVLAPNKQTGKTAVGNKSSLDTPASSLKSKTRKRPNPKTDDDDDDFAMFDDSPAPAKKKAATKSKLPFGIGGQCCVRGCANTFGKYVERIPFPVDDRPLCEKWVELTESSKVEDLYYNNDVELENHAICEYHFLDRDFKPTYPRKLKDGVIPSVFGSEVASAKEEQTAIRKKIENASKKAFPNEYLPKYDLQGRKIVYWPMDVPIPIDPDNPPDPKRKRTIGSIYPNGKPFILNSTGNPLKYLQKPADVDKLKNELEAQKKIATSYLKILKDNGIGGDGKHFGNGPSQEILTLKQKIVSLNLTVKKHENTQRELRREITILRGIEKSHASCKKTIQTLQGTITQLKVYEAAAQEGEGSGPNSKVLMRIKSLEAQNAKIKNMLEDELKKSNRKLVVKLKKVPGGVGPGQQVDQIEIADDGHNQVFEPQVLVAEDAQNTEAHEAGEASHNQTMDYESSQQQEYGLSAETEEDLAGEDEEILAGLKKVKQERSGETIGQ